LLTFIIGPSVYFPFMLNGLNKSIASINRISKLEDISQIQYKRKPEAINAIPEINIKNISFSYLGNKKVIQKFSLFHHGNGIIAVCGKSGSGKTTLLDIISGLYQEECGSVEVNGKISAMSQGTYLFSMSLLENVRLAKINATDEEVIEALKIADADEFAKALPNGYYTMLGEGNGDLSGGQKQRIALARMILSDSPIWLLDEPTSALDTQTESVVINVINEMSKEKLILISAHRKSLIAIADKVINLKGADIIEAI
jgi:ATP-binding cassette, subfamily C, bacterial